MKKIKSLALVLINLILIVGVYPTMAKYIHNDSGKIGDIVFKYYYVDLVDVSESHSQVAINVLAGLNGDYSKDSADSLISTINTRISNYNWDKDTFGSIAFTGGQNAQSLYCQDDDGNVLSDMNFLIEFIPIEGTSNKNINGVDYFYVYLYEGNLGSAGAADGYKTTKCGYHTHIINMTESVDTNGNTTLIVDPYQYKNDYYSKEDLIGNVDYINTGSLAYNSGIDLNLSNDEYYWLDNVSRSKVVRGDYVDSNGNTVSGWVFEQSIMGHAQADWYDENQTGDLIHISQRPSLEPSTWHAGTIDTCNVVQGEHSVIRYDG